MRPMLAKIAPSDLLALRYPLAAEIKYNGIRTIAIVQNKKCKLLSKHGKALNNFEEIVKECEAMPDAVYDGEVISSQGITKLLTRAYEKPGVNKDIPIEYKIFDKLEISEWARNGSNRDYTTRCANLLSERVIIKNPVDLEIYYNYVLKAGHEGLMLKYLDGKYDNEHIAYWYKLQPKDTLDVKITSVELMRKELYALNGEAKFKGDSVIAFVNTGFTDKQRKEFANMTDSLIGKIMLVDYHEIIIDKYERKMLRFPSFKGIRESN